MKCLRQLQKNHHGLHPRRSIPCWRSACYIAPWFLPAPAPVPLRALPPRTPRFVQLHHEDQAAVRHELLRGLMAPAAFTAPKYLYDALGSRLFDAITELPEYYPTRTEAGIFAAHAAEMARCVPAGATLVDLGAGNCQKAARLFEVFKPQRYVAVDISVDYLRDALAALQRQHPAMDMVGVGMDFSQSLALPPEVADQPARRRHRPRCCCFTRAPASATSRPTRRCASCATCMAPARAGAPAAAC